MSFTPKLPQGATRTTPSDKKPNLKTQHQYIRSRGLFPVRPMKSPRQGGTLPAWANAPIRPPPQQQEQRPRGSSTSQSDGARRTSLLDVVRRPSGGAGGASGAVGGQQDPVTPAVTGLVVEIATNASFDDPLIFPVDDLEAATVELQDLVPGTHYWSRTYNQSEQGKSDYSEVIQWVQPTTETDLPPTPAATTIEGQTLTTVTVKCNDPTSLYYRRCRCLHCSIRHGQHLRQCPRASRTHTHGDDHQFEPQQRPIISVWRASKEIFKADLQRQYPQQQQRQPFQGKSPGRHEIRPSHAGRIMLSR